MIRFLLVSVLALGFASCSDDTVPQQLEHPASTVSEVSITVNGPGRYGGGLNVYPTGEVEGGDIDGTPNPFVHEYKKKLDHRQTERIFDLAEAVLTEDPGKDPVVDKSNIVYVIIKTSDGRWHAYFRDVKGDFAMDHLNELDQALKAIDIGPTVHWP